MTRAASSPEQDWRGTAFPNRALVSRERGTHLHAASARSCDLRRPCTSGRACATPVLLIFTPDARTVARVDSFLASRPRSLSHSLPSSLSLACPANRFHPAAPPSLHPAAKGPDSAILRRIGVGGREKSVIRLFSAKIGRLRRYVPVPRNRICVSRECITVIGPLEGASAKGSAGGKSVSGALPPTRVRFHASSCLL